MGRAKDIIVKVIPSKVANEFVKKHHYSGKVVQNSSLHFGAFLDGKLHGVMSYGSPLDKRKVIPLVQPSLWNEMIELNRMAFDDYLPKNSESRCISITIKLLKKHSPHVKWILSFSDGCQCGDGSIYRASGFSLVGINENKTNWNYKGYKFSNVGFRTGDGDKKKLRSLGVDEKYLSSSKASDALFTQFGANKIQGFQFRYIYLIDKTCKITVPILPFSKIDEMGAGMYKGKKVSLSERKQQACEVNEDKRSASSREIGGSNPTHTL
jgi:hypothetical protein